jgi:hypothetical protein
MKWVIKLTDEEIDLLKNSLEDLLNLVQPRVTISGPTEVSGWVESQGIREGWVDMVYRIHIGSNHGIYQQRFGLSTRDGVQGDIKAHALVIAQQFCIQIDPNLKSMLAQSLWKK